MVKNKLVKNNMTKFDYRARRLGIIGMILMVVTLSVGIPVASSLSNLNNTLTRDISVIQRENPDENTQYVVERK